MIEQPSGSPYHTILPVDSQSGLSWNFVNQWKHFRSNSWSDSLDDCRIVPTHELNKYFKLVSLISFSFSNDFFFHLRSILGDSQRQLYDSYKRLYAEILFRWNLLVPRAKILKYLSVNVDNFRDVEYVTECSNCSRVTKAPLCKECRIPLLKCVVCRLPVKGLANACLNCGHGGHTIHMKNWFMVCLFIFVLF